MASTGSMAITCAPVLQQAGELTGAGAQLDAHLSVARMQPAEFLETSGVRPHYHLALTEKDHEP
jgi:hypothetical protein